MRRLNPNDLIVLSTWCDTDPADLAEVAALADDVVQSEWPACRGIQNRNCQIVSARAGINRALEHGARSILKTRTDMAVMAAHVFARARHWQERIGRGGAQGSGMRGRLIVPSSFTRKFIFYHPSDMVMLGASEDMATYWAAPLDPRTGSLLSPEWMDLPLSQLSLSGNPTESYLGTQFCGTIGRPVLGTLADSWAFYRDLFAVVDNDWFDLLWFKNLVIPDSTLRSGVRQTISQGFWERLRANDADLARDLVEVDPGAVALRALTGMAG